MMAGDSSSGYHTLQYDGTIRGTASSSFCLLVMLDGPCVVSWSWQTRALRRAAGNCVLYTYTTKYTHMSQMGMILSGTTAFQGEHWH
jgi:hypothetical protein